MEKHLQELWRGTIILAVLSQLRQERYGYALRERLSSMGFEVQEGTLYPLLRRLETQDLVKTLCLDGKMMYLTLPRRNKSTPSFTRMTSSRGPPAKITTASVFTEDRSFLMHKNFSPPSRKTDTTITNTDINIPKTLFANLPISLLAYNLF